MSSSASVALVTGANKGLGFEMARQLAAQGITVILAARDPKLGEAAAAKLRAEGSTAHFLHLDITERSTFPAAAQFLDEKFGRLDILINNAGILTEELTAGNRTSSTPEDVLRTTLDTNFFAHVALTQTLLPLLKKSPAARIVNMSSSLGSLTQHSDPTSMIYGVKTFAYDTSKTALNSFTVHLANELKDTPIKVNSADPGWVKTDMGTQAAPLELADGAKTGVHLALLGSDGPTGGFFHMGKALPW